MMMRGHAAGMRPPRGGGREEASRVGGATFSEIGRAIGVSRWRAQQIYNAALWKLQRACRQAGLDAGDIRGAAESMLASAEMWAW